MTEIYTPEYLQVNLEIPKEILPWVLATPRLLPGEKEDDYFRLFEMMVAEILPDTDLEWLWTIDLAWLWHDILRYRSWKNAIISSGRRAAVEFVLAKTSPDLMQVSGMSPLIREQARTDAETLRLATNQRHPLKARLEAHGYDEDAINATAFVQGLQPLTMIEKFLTSARRQAAVMTRDVGLHREFARRAKEMNARYLAQTTLLEQNDVESQGAE